MNVNNLNEAMAEVELVKAAMIQQQDEVCQTLGKALGYPRFADDQVNFPDATESDGIFVGEHVAETLAVEAAAEIARLRGERDVLAMERRVSDSEMIALLKRINKEFYDKAESALKKAGCTDAVILERCQETICEQCRQVRCICVGGINEQLTTILAEIVRLQEQGTSLTTDLIKAINADAAARVLGGKKHEGR